jgi:hypothetical protein
MDPLSCRELRYEDFRICFLVRQSALLLRGQQMPPTLTTCTPLKWLRQRLIASIMTEGTEWLSTEIMSKEPVTNKMTNSYFDMLGGKTVLGLRSTRFAVF